MDFRRLNKENQGYYETFMDHNGVKYCSYTNSIVAPINVPKGILNFKELEQRLQTVQLGGISQAPAAATDSCKAQVAILVPYRDRAEQLLIFLRHIHPFLQKQKLDYHLFLVDHIRVAIFYLSKEL